MYPKKESYVKVMIGRFQPLHNGHLNVLRSAIAMSDHVIVVIGSSNEGSTVKNPWSAFEREIMISRALTRDELKKVSILEQQDMPGKDADWVRAVKAQVQDEARWQLPRSKIKYTLVGCHKGADTYYLKLYKGWGRDLISSNDVLNATDIRRKLFLGGDWALDVPGSTASFIDAWKHYRWDDYLKLRLDLLSDERQTQ